MFENETNTKFKHAKQSKDLSFSLFTYNIFPSLWSSLKTIFLKNWPIFLTLYYANVHCQKRILKYLLTMWRQRFGKICPFVFRRVYIVKQSDVSLILFFILLEEVVCFSIVFLYHPLCFSCRCQNKWDDLEVV